MLSQTVLPSAEEFIGEFRFRTGGKSPKLSRLSTARREDPSQAEAILALAQQLVEHEKRFKAVDQQASRIDIKVSRILRRQQAAIDRLCAMPAPGMRPPRLTTRDAIREWLTNYVLATTGASPSAFQACYRKLYGTFCQRGHVNLQLRAQNRNKAQETDRWTGLDIAEELGETEALYALCRKLFPIPKKLKLVIDAESVGV